MITDQQENAFKELVKSIGYESAPDGMLSSVLNQLEEEKSISSKPSVVIIPRWAWVIVAVLLIAFIAYNFFYCPTIDLGIISQLDSLQIPHYELQIPKLFLDSINPMIVVTIILAVFIQLVLIKNYYERSL